MHHYGMLGPTDVPTHVPTDTTREPTDVPTQVPTDSTREPTDVPTAAPTSHTPVIWETSAPKTSEATGKFLKNGNFKSKIVLLNF